MPYAGTGGEFVSDGLLGRGPTQCGIHYLFSATFDQFQWDIVHPGDFPIFRLRIAPWTTFLLCPLGLGLFPDFSDVRVRRQREVVELVTPATRPSSKCIVNQKVPTIL